MIKELNEYINKYNELKLLYSNHVLELDTLKTMEKNYNQLIKKYEMIQSERNQNLKKFELSTKIISDLKIKLNNHINELNNKSKRSQ